MTHLERLSQGTAQRTSYVTLENDTITLDNSSVSLRLGQDSLYVESVDILKRYYISAAHE